MPNTDENATTNKAWTVELDVKLLITYIGIERRMGGR